MFPIYLARFLRSRRVVVGALLVTLVCGHVLTASAQSTIYLPTVGVEPATEADTEPFVDAPVEVPREEPTQGPDEQEPDEAPRPEGTRIGPIEAEAFSAATWTVQNNLGIGTQTPANRIDVRHSANSIARLSIANTSGGSDAQSNVYLQTGTGKSLTMAQYGPGHTGTWGGAPIANRARLRTEGSTTALIMTTGGNAPLIFGTNDAERARITGSGNLGIGTNAPVHKLSVIGGPSWTNSFWTGSIELGNASAIGWRENASGASFGMGQTTDGLFIFHSASNPGTTGSPAVYDLSINNNSNVGIGTTTPAHKLSVIGGPPWTSNIWTGSIALANGSAIGWHKGSGGSSFGIGQSTDGLLIFRTQADPGTIGSPAVYDMIIGNDGRVGIGTYSPASRLHVNGDILANGTIRASNGDIRVTGGSFIDDGVTLNVPDYVFEPDYPLLSLVELRAYIAQEKHLPNVPSEEEIKAGGLDLGAFNMRLLEKVEELTLYTLAQDERIQSQELELTAQEQALTVQAQEVEDLRQIVELLQQQNQTLETRLAALEEQE